MTTPEELAYSESVRAIESQGRSLDELRTRTGVLLAAASIVASFLGAEALKAGDADGLTGWALGAFGVVVGMTLAILWPRRNWRFALGANTLLEDWTGDNPCGDVSAMTRFVARQIETNWRSNKKRIDCMLVLFQVAVGALGAEVVLWTLDLA